MRATQTRATPGPAKLILPVGTGARAVARTTSACIAKLTLPVSYSSEGRTKYDCVLSLVNSYLASSLTGLTWHVGGE